LLFQAGSTADSNRETGYENGRTEIEEENSEASRDRIRQIKNCREKRRFETLIGDEKRGQQKKTKTGESARNLGSTLTLAAGIPGAEPNQEKEHE
jgi:hypothetical protein